MKNLLVALTVVASLFGFTSCLKDPGTPSASASKTTVAVNEEFNLSVSGADNYTCLYWYLENTPTSVGNVTWVTDNAVENATVSIDMAGVYEFTVAVKNCKGESDPCIGTCRDEYSTVTVTVE